MFFMLHIHIIIITKTTKTLHFIHRYNYVDHNRYIMLYHLIRNKHIASLSVLSYSLLYYITFSLKVYIIPIYKLCNHTYYITIIYFTNQKIS